VRTSVNLYDTCKSRVLDDWMVDILGNIKSIRGKYSIIAIKNRLL